MIKKFNEYSLNEREWSEWSEWSEWGKKGKSSTNSNHNEQVISILKKYGVTEIDAFIKQLESVLDIKLINKI